MVGEEDDHEHGRGLEIGQRVGLAVGAEELEVGRGVAELEVPRVRRHLALEVDPALGVALLSLLGGQGQGAHREGREEKKAEGFHLQCLSHMFRRRGSDRQVNSRPFSVQPDPKSFGR